MLTCHPVLVLLDPGGLVEAIAVVFGSLEAGVLREAPVVLGRGAVGGRLQDCSGLDAGKELGGA